MGKVWNFTWNTLWFLGRWAVATSGLAVLDIAQAWANVVSDIGTVVKDTKQKVREILSSPYAKGPMKWYHRVGGALTSPFIGLGALVEGAVRTGVEPTRNAVLNVRDITGNFFKNLWESILRTFDTKRPASDFSFNHLQWKEPKRENWVSKRTRWKKSEALPNTSLTTPSTTVNVDRITELQAQLTNLSAQQKQLQAENQALKAQISALNAKKSPTTQTSSSSQASSQKIAA